MGFSPFVARRSTRRAVLYLRIALSHESVTTRLSSAMHAAHLTFGPDRPSSGAAAQACQYRLCQAAGDKLGLRLASASDHVGKLPINNPVMGFGSWQPKCPSAPRNRTQLKASTLDTDQRAILLDANTSARQGLNAFSMLQALFRCPTCRFASLRCWHAIHTEFK